MNKRIENKRIENKRIENKSKARTFRSSTDVNNYNNFLLELDNQQIKENTIVYEKCKESTNNPDFLDPNLYASKLEFLYEKQKKIQRKLEEEKEVEEKKEKEKEKEEEKIENRRKVNIQFEINDISDLLKMIEKYPDDKEVEYNINMHSLHKIKEPLEELNSMIGLQNLKENIVDQILFYIQNLHKASNDLHKASNDLHKASNDLHKASNDLHKDSTSTSNSTSNKKHLVSNDFMHTVIYGPPGTGKTEIAKIIGSIFSKLGILLKGTFKKVTRSDLVAGFLGQTALKTKDVIKESLGGVLFIDEAYSLGNQEKRDSFSKECIDTLCEALSDHKDDLMVIIAGYETDLNECFFKYNQGLESRFTWRLKINDYNAVELYNIFIKKINDCGWSIDNASLNVRWFEKNKALFKYYGRDIETLFAKTKIAHSRRVFCLDENEKRRLTITDIDKGLEIYLKNGQKKDEDEHIKKSLSYMYS
jgi:SpoVK/Ycf46/Vps4 family AAA+-type ATPase